MDGSVRTVLLSRDGAVLYFIPLREPQSSDLKSAIARPAFSVGAMNGRSSSKHGGARDAREAEDYFTVARGPASSRWALTKHRHRRSACSTNAIESWKRIEDGGVTAAALGGFRLSPETAILAGAPQTVA